MKDYIYTDLALENSSTSRTGKTETVFSEMGIKIIKTTFDSNSYNGLLPRDIYYTVDCGSLSRISEDKVLCVSQIISKKISEIVKHAEHTTEHFSVLVVGLGNRMMCADSLGSLTCDLINVITGVNYKINVYTLAPGIKAQTGIPLSKLTHCASKVTDADLIICVDALCARDASRLGSVIQIGTCGISPGSAFIKKREEISFSTTSVPVISIGIPTVISAQTLVCSLAYDTREDIFEYLSNLYVTPSDCDIISKNGAYIISDAINNAFRGY